MNQTYQAFNRTPVSSLRSLRCRGASDPRDTDPGGETPGGGGRGGKVTVGSQLSVVAYASAYA
eukprot:487828-Prorocentrum_minimum.AAC.4